MSGRVVQPCGRGVVVVFLLGGEVLFVCSLLLLLPCPSWFGPRGYAW